MRLKCKDCGSVGDFARTGTTYVYEWLRLYHCEHVVAESQGGEPRDWTYECGKCKSHNVEVTNEV